VVAPSRTPRASGDRVKTDRGDALRLARLAMAGELSAVVVPDEFLEAARHLTRTRERVRADLLRCRHRVSKLLLVYGRVYDGTTWTQAHRRWLAAQPFEHAPTELAYLDRLAAVDGLIARKDALDERLSRLPQDERIVADGRALARLPRHRHADRAGAASRTRPDSPAPGWVGPAPGLPAVAATSALAEFDLELLVLRDRDRLAGIGGGDDPCRGRRVREAERDEEGGDAAAAARRARS
jgi:hypothetical protein